jgi:hypothetical protein
VPVIKIKFENKHFFRISIEGNNNKKITYTYRGRYMKYTGMMVGFECALM